jgi:isocitrate dehydrogenase
VDPVLKKRFEPVAARLTQDEAKIVGELNSVQGRPVDIGGYFHPDARKCAAAMRPSPTFNAVIDSLRAAPAA